MSRIYVTFTDTEDDKLNRVLKHHMDGSGIRTKTAIIRMLLDKEFRRVVLAEEKASK